jgi:hypothetical protein
MKPDLVPVCVYHDTCHDGALAAWIVQQALPAVDLYPGKYNTPPDLDRLRDRDVFIVDFAWKAEAMFAVVKAAASVTWLDHHKTAVEEREKLDALLRADYKATRKPRKLTAILDMDRSGAGITWDHFHPREARPGIVAFVEDRDLFRFRHAATRALHAWMSSFDLLVENRGFLAEQIQDHQDECEMVGGAILRYHDQLVTQAAEHARLMWVGPHVAAVVVCPAVSLVSDLGHRLLEKFPEAPFACVVMLKRDGTAYLSFRSEDSRADVSEIAKVWGGGGHRNASGATVPNASAVIQPVHPEWPWFA